MMQFVRYPYNHLTSLLLFFLLTACGSAQQPDRERYRLVGGPCEGCEAVFEYGDSILTAVDTLPDFDEEGMRIKVTGTIYKNNGKTPAKDVILYIYHTDQSGVYPVRERAVGWARRHGYIRGWVKTDSNGQYTFYTLKPGTYPDRSEPAHIHLLILEPDGKYYWLDSYHFDDDPLLTEKEMTPEAPRGGSTGLLSLKNEDGIRVGERDIILGKHIPGYE